MDETELYLLDIRIHKHSLLTFQQGYRQMPVGAACFWSLAKPGTVRIAESAAYPQQQLPSNASVIAPIRLCVFERAGDVF